MSQENLKIQVVKLENEDPVEALWLRKGKRQQIRKQ